MRWNVTNTCSLKGSSYLDLHKPSSLAESFVNTTSLGRSVAQNEVQTGVSDYPGAVKVHNIANNVTGVVLNITDRLGCSPKSSGKESLIISVLTWPNGL